MTRAKRFAQVRKLKERGFTNKQVGKILGLSPNYISSLMNDPTGERDRLRKEKYRGTCETCGARTSGGDGYTNAPKKCRACHARNLHEKRHWTQERILEQIARFVKENGRRPVSTEWLQGSHGNRGDGYPPTNTVLREFGSWANAIEAAGFERPHVGTKVRKRRVSTPPKRASRFNDMTLEELCEQLRKLSPWGVAPSTKHHERLRFAFARQGLAWRDACKEAGVRPRKISGEF